MLGVICNVRFRSTVKVSVAEGLGFRSGMTGLI